MARSVSTPRDTAHVVHLDASEYDQDTWGDFIDDVRYVLCDRFPSVTEDGGWIERENRIIASNAFAHFGVSEYCGLAAVWVAPREQGYCGEGATALRDRWIDQIGPSFDKLFSCWGNALRQIGRFSNGEALFQPVNAASKGGLGYSSKEGWL